MDGLLWGQKIEAMESCTGSTRASAQKIKLFSGPGTRRWHRFEISEVPSITDVSSDTGSRVRVINISRGGALLQTNELTAPRSKIQLNFDTSGGVIPLTGFVLRSSVSYPKGVPQYQAAVAFDCLLPIIDASPEPTADTSQTPLESSQSGEFPPDSGESPRRLIQGEDAAIISAFLAISPCSEKGETLDEMSRLNDW